MTRITILDPLPFSEAHMAVLTAVGEVTTYETVPASEAEIVARLQGQHAVITGWCPLSRTVLEAAPDLQCISLWAAGSDYVDETAAHARNIAVFSAAGYASIAVAEFTLGAMLTLLRRIHASARALEQGVNDWRLFHGQDLHGKTVGVIGCGTIAQHVMRLLHAFGARILCYSRTQDQTKLPHGVFTDLNTLLQQSDIVTLHVPLTDNTKHLLNKTRLALMKKDALLINTARGAVVDETALLEAIQTGHLGGAALDVFSVEPPVLGPAWFAQKNILLTPHIAFNSAEAMEKKTALCIQNLVTFYT